jgi:RNA polymerase sigma factor (sigma-70 family)
MEDGGTTTGLAGSAARGGADGRGPHAALFERVLARVYGYFRKVVWDAGEAEECAQRTLVELDRSLRPGPNGEIRYDPSRSFNTWLWLKAHSVFLDWCRERGRRLEPLPDGDGVPARDDATHAVDRRLDAEALLREVERRLGTETYECFVLRYQGELTMQEIADTVGRDRDTVATRIRAAHALIDRLLEKTR